jgi:hypothetical protein
MIISLSKSVHYTHAARLLPLFTAERVAPTTATPNIPHGKRSRKAITTP